MTHASNHRGLSLQAPTGLPPSIHCPEPNVGGAASHKAHDGWSDVRVVPQPLHMMFRFHQASQLSSLTTPLSWTPLFSRAPSACHSETPVVQSTPVKPSKRTAPSSDAPRYVVRTLMMLF